MQIAFSVTKLGELSPQRQLPGSMYFVCSTNTKWFRNHLFFIILRQCSVSEKLSENLKFKIIEVSVDNHINKHRTKALQNSLICIFCHCLYKEIHIALISPRYYTLIFYVRSEFLTKIICSSLWGNSNKLLFTYIDFLWRWLPKTSRDLSRLSPSLHCFPLK